MNGLEQVEPLLKKYADGKSGTLCKKCKMTLEPDYTGMHEVLDGFKCDDCYYEDLGDIIDDYPIYSPKYSARREV